MKPAEPMSPVAQLDEISPPTRLALASTSALADRLFVVVREVLQTLLQVPMKEVEVATALNVSKAQAKAWLLRLISEGTIEQRKRPARYVVKRSNLFD